MKQVRLLRNWRDIEVLRQTPGGTGVWEDIQFTEAAERSSDYTIVLNRPPADVTVNCPPQKVWAIIQEPPNEVFARLHQGDPCFARVYTTDETLDGPRYFHSQPATAWHVDRDYDALVRAGIPEKKADLSWVTTNKMVFRGHRARMKFLRTLQDEIDLDLFGYGIRPIADKWDGLAPYRYSLAIENHSNPYYWSEKIADCFLAWTMPVYYGCTRIEDYFPPEAMIRIDIHDPGSIDQIRAGIRAGRWERSLEAIACARRLVLDRYQFFPFIAGEIHAFERDSPARDPTGQPVWIPHDYRQDLSGFERARDLWRRLAPNSLRRRLGRLRQCFE